MRKARFAAPTPHSIAGVSLIELMIAVTLGLIVLGALATLFANTSASRNELERTSRQIENGRFAMEILSEDIRLAGFYGELDVRAVATPGALPDPCSTTDTDWNSAIRVPLQAYDNAVGVPACLPGNVKANTDVLVVRRVSSCEAGIAGCPASVGTDAHVQVAKCNTETLNLSTLYKLALGNANPPFNLHKRDCATLAPLRRYIVNIYYISTDNGATPAVSVPTLKRLEFTGSGWNQVPLVEGIEELNLEYGVDNNSDGAPDAYTADPSTYTYTGCTTCTAVNNWMNVVTVRVSLLARNVDISPRYTDSKTYSLGLDAAGNPVTVTPGDAYRRHVYTGLVRVVNASQRKEAP